MKKIIPFKKEIKFDDNIYEITSISLEHSLHKEGMNICGNFIVSGEYRITESSINTNVFNYDLPFQIDIDNKYNIDNVEIDIDDFYYEILDNKYLVINIEVKLDRIQEIIIEKKEINDVNNDIELLDRVDVKKEKKQEDKEEVPEVKEVVVKKEDKEERCIDEVKSLFSNMDTVDTYVSYKVYIVRENDTIQSIIDKYQVTLNDIEQYNDVLDIKIGDKIIIPYVKN